jgi:hypothetical protein
MKAPEVSVDRMSTMAAGRGRVRAVSVASASENKTIKAKRKRFVMLAPARIGSFRSEWLRLISRREWAKPRGLVYSKERTSRSANAMSE